MRIRSLITVSRRPLPKNHCDVSSVFSYGIKHVFLILIPVLSFIGEISHRYRDTFHGTRFTSLLVVQMESKNPIRGFLFLLYIIYFSSIK